MGVDRAALDLPAVGLRAGRDTTTCVDVAAAARLSELVPAVFRHGVLATGSVVGGFTLSAPAFNPAPAGAPPLFPLLFITIACGAVSGFHSLGGVGHDRAPVRPPEPRAADWLRRDAYRRAISDAGAFGSGLRGWAKRGRHAIPIG
jgi:hypothetical protein